MLLFFFPGLHFPSQEYIIIGVFCGKTTRPINDEPQGYLGYYFCVGTNYRRFFRKWRSIFRFEKIDHNNFFWTGVVGTGEGAVGGFLPIFK